MSDFLRLWWPVLFLVVLGGLTVALQAYRRRPTIGWLREVAARYQGEVHGNGWFSMPPLSLTLCGYPVTVKQELRSNSMSRQMHITTQVTLPPGDNWRCVVESASPLLLAAHRGLPQIAVEFTRLGRKYVVSTNDEARLRRWLTPAVEKWLVQERRRARLYIIVKPGELQVSIWGTMDCAQEYIDLLETIAELLATVQVQA